MRVQHQVAYAIDLGQKACQSKNCAHLGIKYSLNVLIFAFSHFFQGKKVGKKERHFFTRKLLYYIIMLQEWIAV